jgi:hypothetical protein
VGLDIDVISHEAVPKPWKRVSENRMGAIFNLMRCLLGVNNFSGRSNLEKPQLGARNLRVVRGIALFLQIRNKPIPN